MAQLAGLELERRAADWHGSPFTVRQREPRLGLAQALTRPAGGRPCVPW